MLLQGQGQVDRLEGGSGFVEVLHGPFAKETGRILPELIGVVGGTGGEREDLAVAHIHHQGHPPLGAPLLHLLSQGQLGHLLQAGIKGQLQAQVVAVEHPRPQTIGQGGAIGAAAQLARRFMAAQVLVAALLQARLGHPLQVEEADHIGEQGAQGVNPLGVGLQIQPTDAQLANAMGRFGIQFGGQLHAGLARADRGHQGFRGQAQDRSQLLGHIQGRALATGRIAREVEVARMGPNGEALLIEGHHAAGAVDDRAPFADRRNRLGLHGPGLVEQLGPLDHLNPGQASRQTHQARGKDQINGQQPG